MVARVITLLLPFFVLPVDALVVRNSSQLHKKQDDIQRNSSQVENKKEDEGQKAKRLQGCLHGKRIVLIGPSTSKADYLALAYLAEYGRLPSEDAIFFGQGQVGPNPLNEMLVKANPHALPWEATAPNVVPGCHGSDWETYMRYSNMVFNGREVCDCYKFGVWTGPLDVYNSTENRIYYNPSTDTMIAYFQWFGDIVPPRGTFDIMSVLVQGHSPQQCPAGQFPGRWSWAHSLAHFLQHVVRYAKPTHVVVSSAFWPVQPAHTQLWQEVAAAGPEAVRDTGGKILWRTTPQRNDHPAFPSPRVDMTPFGAYGWQIFPAQQLITQYQGAHPSQSIFIDFAHLQPHAQSFVTANFVQTQICV